MYEIFTYQYLEHEYKTMVMHTSETYHFILSAHLCRSNSLFHMVPVTSHTCMGNQTLSKASLSGS